MYRFLAVCSLVLPTFTAVHAADPTPDVVLSQFAESMTKAAELLDTIKDAKTATEAKPKLDELATKQTELKARIGKMTPDERSNVTKKSLSAMSESEQKLTTAHDRIHSKEKLAYKVLRGSKLFDSIEKRLESSAVNYAQMLRTQAMAFTAKNRGQAPKELKALVVKEKGRTPLIDGGEKALIDPWGGPYQYELSTDAYGNPSSHVWTVSPYSGKKLGNPPSEKK